MNAAHAGHGEGASGHRAATAHLHHIASDADAGKLRIALSLIVGLMAVEVTVGILSHSLALLSDAAHMLTDGAAIGISLYAMRLAMRPAKGALTYGLRRAEILAALTNGATLLVLGLLIVYEAINRLISPPHVTGSAVLAVALIGVIVNLAATITLSKANRESLNIEGAFQHVRSDLAAFVATAIAGALIIATGFSRSDGIASLVIAAIMLIAAHRLLKASGRVLLEAAPEGLDVEAIGRTLAGAGNVREVHDLHVWEVSSGFPALSAHVLVPEGVDCHEVRRGLESVIKEQFQIEHTTLQVEHEGERLLSIQSQADEGPNDSQPIELEANELE